MVAWAAEPGILPVTYLFFLSLSVLLTFLTFGIFSAVVIGTLEKTRDRYSGNEQEEEEADGSGGSAKGGKIAAGLSSNLSDKAGQELKSAEAGPSPVRNGAFLTDETLAPATSSLTKGPIPATTTELWHPRTDEERQLFVQSILRGILNSYFWQGTYLLSIIANGVALGADQYNTSAEWRLFCQWTYLSVNIVFLVNLLLKLAMSGSFVELIRSNDNKLELSMVLLVIIGLLSNIKALTLIASLRIFKLMAFFPALADLLDSAITGTPTMFRVLIFICIVTFVGAVTARYIIGHSMDSEENSNFADLYSANRVLFQLLTGDAWSAVLYDAMRAQADQWTEVAVGGLVLGWFIFATVIIMNLFAAVIVANFDVKDTIDRYECIFINLFVIPFLHSIGNLSLSLVE